MFQYHNPVIRGFNPDPSICRVGNDYYLVTSSFEYFPGVPLYHSTNLANWELLGHCLTSAEQLPLQGCSHSGGIYAPTIRYHAGRYYMTTTNASSIRNFIVHTDDLVQGWSLPVQVKQTGIDPSLFFDDDGKVYFTSTGFSEGKNAIQMCEIDPLTGTQHTVSRIISYGCGGCWPEAPHIYKRNGFYYLVLAEGGSEYGHHVTVQRSTNIWGPYTANPYNPILFHQDQLGISPIQATGHADLVEDANGNWWMVCLGIRRLPYNLLHNLGRETFLAPLVWTEDGWPVLQGGRTLSLEMEGPLPFGAQPRSQLFRDDFSAGKLRPDWTFIRNPENGCWSLTENPGFLTLCGHVSLSDPRRSPAFLGVRQTEHRMTARTLLSGPLADGQRAGITAYYTCDYHYEIYLKRAAGEYCIAVNRRIHDLEAEVFCQKINYENNITLSIDADERAYRFGYALPNHAVQEAGKGAVAGLCTEGTADMTFTGTFIGLFTTGGSAAFSYFEIKNTPAL